MNEVTRHKPTKRRNLHRWMIARRRRRLETEILRGTATSRQKARERQLVQQITGPREDE